MGISSKERIEAVVNLEALDRVPVGPLLDNFAATYSGYTNAEIMEDGDKRIEAVLKTMTELGPFPAVPSDPPRSDLVYGVMFARRLDCPALRDWKLNGSGQ